MTQATDKDNNVSYISHTTPAVTPILEYHRKQNAMSAAVYHFVSHDVDENTLLWQVVDQCRILPATQEFLGKPQDSDDQGYVMRLHSVNHVISQALKCYTYGRKYPS